MLLDFVDFVRLGLDSISSKFYYREGVDTLLLDFVDLVRLGLDSILFKVYSFLIVAK